MADEKQVQHTNRDSDERDPGETDHAGIELSRGNRRCLRQRLLDHVVEWTVPGINRDADLHRKIRIEDDQR
ncbi:hypothetical protein D3C72_2436020 [compost metagenome]